MARQAYSRHERQQDALRKRACRRMGAGPSERSPQGIRMGKGRGREPEPNPFICAPFKSRYGAILEPESKRTWLHVPPGWLLRTRPHAGAPITRLCSMAARRFYDRQGACGAPGSPPAADHIFLLRAAGSGPDDEPGGTSRPPRSGIRRYPEE